jgi:hypothetical protein
MTQSDSPPTLLACVLGRVNGLASPAVKFVLIWKALNDSLKFYFGFSEGRFLRKVLLLTKKERS